MDGFFAPFWFLVLSPLLPCLALLGTGLTILFLRIVAALAYEYL